VQFRINTPLCATISETEEIPARVRPGGIHMLDNLFTPTHLIIILVIALLIFGPRKLPELGKGLGEGLRGFKDGIKGGGNDAAKQETVATKTDAAPQVTPQTK
jgi:sec-independent protein translocase protein TatA